METIELVRTLPYPPEHGAVRGARFEAVIDRHDQAVFESRKGARLIAPHGTFLIVEPDAPLPEPDVPAATLDRTGAGLPQPFLPMRFARVA